MGFFEKSLLVIANQMVKDYGHLQELHLNTTDKSGSFTAVLNGESSPIEVTIGNYELSKKGDKVQLTLKGITCSREWMHKLVNKLKPEPVIDLPDSLASMLKFGGFL